MGNDVKTVKEGQDQATLLGAFGVGMTLSSEGDQGFSAEVGAAAVIPTGFAGIALQALASTSLKGSEPNAAVTGSVVKLFSKDSSIEAGAAANYDISNEKLELNLRVGACLKSICLFAVLNELSADAQTIKEGGGMTFLAGPHIPLF